MELIEPVKFNISKDVYNGSELTIFWRDAQRFRANGGKNLEQYRISRTDLLDWCLQHDLEITYGDIDHPLMDGFVHFKNDSERFEFKIRWGV